MNYLTVSALTKYIKTKLETDKHLTTIYLKGEISNFKRHNRGHLYFRLKDSEASINAIMFASDALRLNFEPKEGDDVLVTGRMSVYMPSGNYSIQVRSMEKSGIGDLYLEYEKLKKELEQKGYFKDDHKKPIPQFPRVIGVVTSETGAVIEDIKNTVRRRYLLSEILLYPAQVQGKTSAESIRRAIEKANRERVADLLIVGRGGGSIEDLWSFNELATIEAIYRSEIPIITAIGHETDFTIADFVADLRAPTPTAAAELATPNTADLIKRIDDSRSQLEYHAKRVLSSKETELVYLDQRLDRLSPSLQIERLKETFERLRRELGRNYTGQLHDQKQRLVHLHSLLRPPSELVERSKTELRTIGQRADERIEQILSGKSHRFEVLRTRLESRNPLALMDKGFALITKDDRVVTSVRSVAVGERISVRFKDGSASAEITGKKES
ncbi:MAG: exodeoxyribonuclease VII large subunit [Acholeplasmataceae bacterium]